MVYIVTYKRTHNEAIREKVFNTRMEQLNFIKQIYNSKNRTLVEFYTLELVK